MVKKNKKNPGGFQVLLDKAEKKKKNRPGLEYNET